MPDAPCPIRERRHTLVTISVDALLTDELPSPNIVLLPLRHKCRPILEFPLDPAELERAAVLYELMCAYGLSYTKHLS